MNSGTQELRNSGTARRAFTLIELLVVVGMIALIAGSVTSAMASAAQRTRVQKATAEVKTLTQALLAYENLDSKHELPTLTRAKADRTTLKFLLGDGGSTAGGQNIPSLVQAALTSQGVMRDPWGQPYLVTIRKGAVQTPAMDSVQTGYFLPNFYRLSEGERK